MVFQDLHRCHRAVGQIVAHQTVTATHQIQPLNIKMLYGFALVQNPAGWLYLNTGHSLQHIGYHPVLLTGKAAHQIADGIPPLNNGFGTHYKLTQVQDFR